MDLIVGMGEQLVSDQPGKTLKTYALASCVAVTVYCPRRQASGMLHLVLPKPLSEKDKLDRPSYFATTGVPLLIRQMNRSFGCKASSLVAKIYGGADSMWQNDVYNIGKSNIAEVKKLLQDMGVPIYKTDLQGSDSRSLAMDVSTGAVTVYRQPLMQISQLNRAEQIQLSVK